MSPKRNQYPSENGPAQSLWQAQTGKERQKRTQVRRAEADEVGVKALVLQAHVARDEGRARQQSYHMAPALTGTTTVWVPGALGQKSGLSPFMRSGSPGRAWQGMRTSVLAEASETFKNKTPHHTNVKGPRPLIMRLECWYPIASLCKDGTSGKGLLSDYAKNPEVRL